MAVRSFLRPHKTFRWLGSGFLAMTLVGALASATPAQEPAEPAPADETEEVETPSEVRRLDQISDSDFSIVYADQLTTEATDAIADQQFLTAIDKLTEARELYNQLSLYYQELAEMFFGIDTRQNRSNREKAIETAQKRDQATYQLALIHRTQDDPEKAVPLLMEVLRSQQPTRELGQQAYQQLYELGFVEAPYEFR
ncbi:hypothetical protein PN498_05170 [Oscillatoria sp. CS-180]|uniref:hypothetical protein n=1 Tax=Oscillatoria sp. CS-180 TaxID=3021720 RepID=UPI00232A8BDD|nr:hypothetical protein [Oscillatoria sp. CS-180]MDB9525369.1 hypothetical protein [Oscillatoria sp. CS-180]